MPVYLTFVGAKLYNISKSAFQFIVFLIILACEFVLMFKLYRWQLRVQTTHNNIHIGPMKHFGWASYV